MWESTYLEVSIDHEAVVHVFQAQDDFGGVETHLLLAEHTVLRQVVVQVSSCKHQSTGYGWGRVLASFPPYIHTHACRHP